jgi:hypothetical protein
VDSGTGSSVTRIFFAKERLRSASSNAGQSTQPTVTVGTAQPPQTGYGTSWAGTDNHNAGGMGGLLVLHEPAPPTQATQQFASIRKSLYFRMDGPGTAAHPRPLRGMAPLEREEPPLCDISHNDSLRPRKSHKPPLFFGEPLRWSYDHAHSDVAPVFHQCTRGELLVTPGGTSGSCCTLP